VRTVAAVAAVAPAVPVFCCRHAARDLVRRPDGVALSLSELRDRSVWLLSAIARPATFEATVRATGARVQGHTRGSDHHAFDAATLEKLARDVVARDACSS
jgi:tetraacyldisaccharide-1-P 4'-kinase